MNKIISLSCLFLLVNSVVILIISALPSPVIPLENLSTNMNRAFGSNKKKNASSASTVLKYPWDSTKTKNTQQTLSYTEYMKSFMRPDEEPFKDDYYDDYDFEFAKGMIRNDIFEVKKNKDNAKRLQDGL